ncbi:hypothetical protein [Bacillus marasmi]|uniref:hypothetical protein n=1 Tax=Bacillus marasmi TaxID=1926279 RepID=UPI0011C7C893|nr:hypothetical protein [Bacillus marasmi]
MNVKPRQIPLIVEEIDAVLSRLQPFHPKRAQLEDEKRNYMSGYYGERQIDYFLDAYITDSHNTMLHFDYSTIKRSFKLTHSLLQAISF